MYLTLSHIQTFLQQTFENIMAKEEIACDEQFTSMPQCWNYSVIEVYYHFAHVEKSFNPFPHTKILQQTTLNIFCQNLHN